MEPTAKHILDRIKRFSQGKTIGLDLGRWGVDDQPELTEIPPEVFELDELQALYLGRNSLSTIPDSIVRLRNLTSLDLGNNQLTTLPEAISELKSLTRLYLGSNRLESIPESIFKLTNLTELDLSGNQLRAIPEQISQLQDLTGLYLSSNRLKSLPESISKLGSLTSFDLSGNQLEELPESISELHNLKLLYLGKNRITALPLTIFHLDSLMVLDLGGNPLETPPPEIVEQGVGAIKDYLIQLSSQGTDRLHEAKLVVVGEPGAGKTSLAKKIQDPNYVLQDEDSTRGIAITRWSFPMDDGKPFRVNIWDFGGQEIYHATHQFFLTKRSLYALVADTRNEDTDFRYWLSVVGLLSANSPLLIIKNEKKDRHREINERQLRRDFPNLKETLATNLQGTRGLSDIVREIKHHITGLPHIGAPLPKTWVKVREALEREVRDHIDVNEYLDICKENGFAERKDKMQLSSYLHDLGVCLHFQDDPLLKKTVILNPKWGTDAVYRVLDNDKVIGNLGEFDREDLANIWNEEQYINMQDELLQLMINFKLCYRIPHTQSYVATQLLTENQPTYDWIEDSNIVLRYSYEFMPKGIISQFIVAMHIWIERNKNVWRSGVVLAMEETRAEIIEHYEKKELRIRVEGKHKKELLTLVTSEIENIHRSYEQLQASKWVPCNCKKCDNAQQPNFYSFDILQRFLDDSRPIQCQKSYEMMDVESLIRGVSPTERKQIFISYSHADVEWLKRLELMLKPLERTDKISFWSDAKIKAGAHWQEDVKRALASTSVAVLLVSPHFLASDFIAENELPILLKAAEEEGVTVLWVAVSHSMFKQTEIGKYQAANDPSKPLDCLSSSNANEVLVAVCEKIQDAAKRGIADWARRLAEPG